jgi:hypothetical protein
MNIKEIAAQSLQDSLVYLESIDPGIYAMPLDLLFGASIGQHTRHFIEFYQCLLDQAAEGQCINYALRARDLRIEEDPAFAAQRVREVCKRLDTISGNMPCVLMCDEQIDGTSGVTVETNFDREIIYNIEHTIHHLAIIKIGLHAIAPRIPLPGHFGIAPSTIKHRQEQCAQ